jgi:hypothetical protein
VSGDTIIIGRSEAERLSTAVEALASAIRSTARNDGETTRVQATDQGQGVTRDLDSPGLPPDQDHLRELDASVRDGASRAKWLFLDERLALRHFGTPTRVWTAQGSLAEYWDYDLGEGRVLTLVFNRGRLIDAR